MSLDTPALHQPTFSPSQLLSPEQHIELGRHFGTLTEGHPLQGSPEPHPEIIGPSPARVVGPRRCTRSCGCTPRPADGRCS